MKNKIYLKSLSLFIIISALFLISCSNSNDDPNIYEEKITAYVDSIYNNHNFNLPAMIVYVKDSNKKINLLHSKGYTNLENLTTYQTNQLFSIGSNTKTFTVMTFLELIQEGILNPETVLSEYYPKIKNADSIKLKYLANMSSGIPNYTENMHFLLNYLLANFGTSLDFQQILDYINQEDFLFAPGTDYYYSNTNTRILSNIIEQVTGNTIKYEIENRFINKLGLHNTYYPDSPGMPSSDYVYGYEDLEDDGIMDDYSGVYDPSVFGSAGCMISNIYDMEKWVKYIANGGSLSEDILQLREEGVYSDTDYLTYKMGFAEVNGWIGHTGGVPGYSTLILHNPTLDNTIIIIQNSLLFSYPNWDLFEGIVDIIY